MTSAAPSVGAVNIVAALEPIRTEPDVAAAAMAYLVRTGNADLADVLGIAGRG